MDNKITVLVVDDNVEFCDLLRQYINKSDDLKAVGSANDGAEGIEQIKKLCPDVVILDIVMPKLDGIEVLEKIEKSEIKHKPIFIILSAVGQDTVTKKAMELGAEYYMVKPFDIEVLISRIKELYKGKNNYVFTTSAISTKKMNEGYTDSGKKLYNAEVDASMIMHDAGIPAHLSGYRYLREAIIITVQNPNVFSSVTKLLYPAIAEKFNSTPQKVERSIRNAIVSAWSNESDGLRKVFGEKVSENWDSKPSNSQFIAAASEKIRIMKGLKL